MTETSIAEELKEQCWDRDWGRVVSPGLLFSAGAVQGLRNQMALFCFPDEPAQPLARSRTNTVWRGWRKGGDAFVGERHIMLMVYCLIVCFSLF